jgi:hypothetical protein
LTAQGNALTKRNESLKRWHDDVVRELNDLGLCCYDVKTDTFTSPVIASLKSMQGATFNSLAEFCGRGFLQRVRWLVTGR